MKICTACGAEYGDEVLFCQRDGTPLRPAGPTTDLVGQVIADRYHITRKLGEGGMGQVYLAEHVKMGRRCAVKIMTQGMMSDPDAISRFNREAANASRISHPNVCAIYDFGETPEGLIYLAMEFIEGRSLTALLDESGTLPLARAATILTQCADALQVAHDLGIVHRDLKPDNIMVVTARGRDTVKVVDFGIAKAVGSDSGEQKVTRTGFVVGTPEYMSPEQLAGDPVDGRSDIYSLGLVFYRMLTGWSPFPADSQQETMIKRLTDDPLPLAVARPDVRFPAELQRVMDRALGRAPTERYASAAEFGREVRALAGSATGQVDTDAGTQMVRAGEGGAGAVPATRVDPAVAARPRAARRPGTPARRGLPLVPVAIVAVVLAMGGGAYVFRRALFGGGQPADSLRPPDSVAIATGSQTGQVQHPDTQRTQAAQPAGRRGGTSTPAESTARSGQVPPPPPDTTTSPVVTRPRPAGLDEAAAGTLLSALEDTIIEHPERRSAARVRADALFRQASLPSNIRARAAMAVSDAYREDAVLACARGDKAGFQSLKQQAQSAALQGVSLDTSNRYQQRANLINQVQCNP